jgi:predicted secreted protein
MGVAKSGFGAKLAYEDTTPGTYIPLTGVTKIRPFAKKADSIDSTDMDSTAGTREKIAGLIDNGQVMCDLNYNEKEVTHIKLETLVGVKTKYRMTFGGGTPKVATFDGFLDGLTPEVPLDNKQTCSASIQISGVITWT